MAVTGNYITTAAGTALTVDGVSGSYWITTSLIGLYDGGNPVTLVFPGLVIATQEWVNAQSFSGGGITYTSLASGTLSGANFTFSTPAPIVAAWDAAETKAFVIAFGNDGNVGKPLTGGWREYPSCRTSIPAAIRKRYISTTAVIAIPLTTIADCCCWRRRRL